MTSISKNNSITWCKIRSVQKVNDEIQLNFAIEACVQAEFLHPSWKQAKGIYQKVLFKICLLFHSKKYKTLPLHFSSCREIWHHRDKGVHINPEQQLERININTQQMQHINVCFVKAKSFALEFKCRTAEHWPFPALNAVLTGTRHVERTRLISTELRRSLGHTGIDSPLLSSRRRKVWDRKACN